MLPTGVIAQLDQHLSVRGLFSPFTYSIGLEDDVDDAVSFLQDYPLSRSDPETVAKFLTSLTFFHEATHLAQYVSSSYGLRTLRLTNIALNYVMKGSPWTLPILGQLIENIETLDDLHRRALVRFLVFLDASGQLTLQSTDERGLLFLPASTSLDSIPWSPYFGLFPGEREEVRTELAAEVDALVHDMPVVHWTRGNRKGSVLLNAAALMEAYALLAEFNHVGNAFASELSFSEMSHLVSNNPIYTCTLQYAIEQGAAPGPDIIPRLAMCIDAALMYDPFTFSDSTLLEIDGSKPKNVYPGETFIRAIGLLKNLPPLASSDMDAFSRMYVTLCSQLQIPHPKQMADDALKRAESLLVRDSEKLPLLDRALRFHILGLRKRAECPTEYPMRLLTSNPVIDLITEGEDSVTFFNIHSKEASHFHPANVDSLQLHYILVQALTKSEINCPMKAGTPFKCHRAEHEKSVLCTWTFESDEERGTAECMADMFDRPVNPLFLPKEERGGRDTHEE